MTAGTAISSSGATIDLDDGSGLEFASGVWHHEQLWVVKPAESTMMTSHSVTLDGIGGIDDVLLPGAVARGAGGAGDIGGLYVYDGGGPGGTATIVADASGSD